MLALLVIYSLLAGLFLVVGAHAGEAMLRVLRLPRRWAWAAALAAVVVLTTSAPFRSLPVSIARPDGVSVTATDIAVGATGDAPALSMRSVFDRVVNVPMHALAGAFAAAVRGAASADGAWLLSSTLAGPLVFLWILASAVLAGVLLCVTVHSRMRVRSWSVTMVAGERVRISDAAGPAVMGVWRPEIVIPRWLLDRPVSEQRLIVAHERSHVDARDHLLLLFGCSVLVLLPWNVCAWWMMRRMRLALEIDCDARVLRGTTSALPYGRLLLATAERRSTLRLLNASLADSTTDLERRLTAMNAMPGSHPVLRAAGTALAAAVLFLAACEADLPTSADLEAMSVAEMVEVAAPLAPLKGAVYVVDGVIVSSETANAIAPEEIEVIHIRKRAFVQEGTDESPVIEIITHDAARPLEISGKGTIHAGRVRFNNGDDDPHVTPESASPDALLFIDGEQAELSALRSIDPQTIESIEVVKGAAAERMVDHPDARNGVIKMRLKATPLTRNE